MTLRGMDAPTDAREIMEAYIGCDSMDGSFTVRTTSSESVDMNSDSLRLLGACINDDLQLPCVIRPSDAAASIQTNGFDGITNCCMFVAKALGVLGVPSGNMMAAAQAAHQHIPELGQFLQLARLLM